MYDAISLMAKPHSRPGPVDSSEISVTNGTAELH